MKNSESYRGVPVLVLGASGFIGRWVARALAHEGASPWLVVRNRAVSSTLERLGVRGDTIVCDLERRDDVHSVIDRLRPAIVFNLAGYGVDPAERTETRAESLNTRLVEYVADVLASYETPQWAGQRLVHVGSALEYGLATGDLSEDTAPQPTTLYGRTKLAGTLALQAVCHARGIKGLTARLFTVYGAGEHSHRLLPTLLNARCSNQPIDLTEGRQRRDFTYVEEVAEGLLRLGASADSSSPGAVINLATGHLTPVRAFAGIAADVLGINRARLRFGALTTRAEEMHHEPVTTGRLERLTSWRPQTSIADGIARATVWHDSLISNRTIGSGICQ